jgi:hypothetical protein
MSDILTEEEILAVIGIVDVFIWEPITCKKCPIVTVTEAIGVKREMHLSPYLAKSYLLDCITDKAKHTLTKFILEHS